MAACPVATEQRTREFTCDSVVSVAKSTSAPSAELPFITDSRDEVAKSAEGHKRRPHHVRISTATDKLELRYYPLEVGNVILGFERWEAARHAGEATETVTRCS